MQSLNYRNSGEGRSVMEEHRNGDLALFLYLYVRGEINTNHALAAEPGNQIPGMYPAVLVFYANVVGARVINDWQDQFVLVSDIGIVKSPQERISSRVRLYFGRDPFEESGAGPVYLSLERRLVQRLRTIRERKLSPFGERQFERQDNGYPGVIQGRSQIVHGVSCDEGYIDQALLETGALIFDRGSSGLLVYLDGRYVMQFQRQDFGLNITDALIGPVDLMARIKKT
jgi:hypothetical protein